MRIRMMDERTSLELSRRVAGWHTRNVSKPSPSACIVPRTCRRGHQDGKKAIEDVKPVEIRMLARSLTVRLLYLFHRHAMDEQVAIVFARLVGVIGEFDGDLAVPCFDCHCKFVVFILFGSKERFL